MLLEEELKSITIKELLKMNNLKIPYYQRPYKWTERNVNQLIDDILFHKDKQGYRLGTLVLHYDNYNFNIVDGQQRTITIFLLAYALSKAKKLPNDIKVDFSNLEFIPDNTISKNNIIINYDVIKKRINEFDNAKIDFLLNKCELVKVVIGEENIQYGRDSSLAEAFQFFDSQNARGKALEPHDLLKAFHLREMNDFSTEDEKKKVVEQWEKIDSTELNILFNNYLFKIKKWIRGETAGKSFTKKDIDIFKGVTIEAKEMQNYPFIKPSKINNYYVNTNKELGQVENLSIDYPFQIDQIVINGKRFFEMVIHYNKLRKYIENIENTENELNNGIKNYIKNIHKEAIDILDKIDNYEGRYRIGDKYIRNLFNCALFYYIDKFAKVDLEEAIKKIFIWAYTLRLENKSVFLASVDNIAKSKESFFSKNYYAINHKEILNWHLNSIKKEYIIKDSEKDKEKGIDVVATKVDSIKDLFKELEYVKQ